MPKAPTKMGRGLPLRKEQLSPTDHPVEFKFWSDTNQVNFEYDMRRLGVRFEAQGKGLLFVYDDSADVKRIAMDWGADMF
jgi:hypothetical protein